MMPFQTLAGNQQSQNLGQIEDAAMNVVESVCSIITMPLEMALRPRYGSEYCSVPTLFLAAIMMMIIPAFLALFNGLSQMLPIAKASVPIGMIGFGTISTWFFIGAFVHGIRVWRRMLHMELEDHSEFEGPPLPFFSVLPKGTSFWFVRIVYEPAFLFLASFILSNLFIIQTPVGAYLKIAAFALVMKNYVRWLKSWRFIRHLMNMRYAGPIIASLVENNASDSDLASINLASFPKNIPPEMRKSAALHIARMYSEGDSHGNH